jgi:membrane associated rhomboid family serine protease
MAMILTSLLSCTNMPSCLKCGAALAVNEEGVAPVLCDRCAGVATGRARRSMATGGLLLAPATTLLMAINIAVYIGMVVTGGLQFTGEHLIRWGGNYGPLTIGGEYWRLVTAGFVHGSVFHIGMNMWCLYSLGRLSERLFGKWQTFLIYMITGVGGALLSVAYDNARLSVGASGAIFGIVGAVLAGLKFGDLAIPEGQRRATLSSVVMFAVISFSLGGLGRTDNMCHLGGFISGLLLGLPLGAFARGNKTLQIGTFAITSLVLVFAGRELVQDHGAEAQKQAAAVSWQLKNYASAVRFLESYTAARPNDDDGLVFLGEAYAATNQRDKAIDAFQRALKANQSSDAARQALEQLHAPVSPQTK